MFKYCQYLVDYVSLYSQLLEYKKVNSLMVTTLMVLQGIVSIFLIITVLLQFGKGAEAGLMGGTSDSVMTGGQQGNVLSKITTFLAIIFLGNSVYLAKIQGSKNTQSILDSEAPIAQPLNRDVKKTDAAKPEATPAPTTAPSNKK